MRIALVCNDTRGGVQPYAALAGGLRAAGHDVRAVAPAPLAPLFDGLGIAVHLISMDPAAEAATTIAERGTLASMRLMAREMPRRLGKVARETLVACDGAEVLTGGVGGMITGLAVAEKLGVPFVRTHLQPLDAPTGAYPGVLFGGLPQWVGPLGRSVSHRLSEQALWMPFRRAMRSARRDALGLHGEPRTRVDPTVLYGFSRRVVPVPDLGGLRRADGYWVLETSADWRPPPALAAFLADGRPVVAIGFGSMASSDPEATRDLVAGAARDAGARAVLIGMPGSDDPDVIAVDAIPHDWLFARVDAVVHHGGAGTTGAALLAGARSIVVPFAVDQPFWATRVAALGVGPRPLPRKRLTQAALATTLRAALADDAMRDRAVALGSALRSETGVAHAVDWFDRYRPGPSRQAVGAV